MNEQNVQQHIDAILAHLDKQHAQGAEQQRPTTDEREAAYQQQPQTFIDVYVIEREAEEPPTIESTLEPPTQENQDDEEPETPTAPPREPRTTRPRLYIVVLVALYTLLISAATSIYLVQLFTPSATITLVTTSQQITSISTLQIVTNGTADPTKNQVAGRTLPAITMSQARTIPTTGTTRQAAQAAHGFITFYNAAPYVQTVNAGTLITGADGIQVITDQDATIPAAIMPTEGQTTILGHAATTGPTGNIRAGDIYGACCRLNVFVTNGAFHGGQDARTYQTVTTQDINSVVSSLKTSLDQSVQAALQTQIQPSETLITPLSCTSNVTPNHQLGEEATQVHVTMNETCTGTTYNTQTLTTLATHRATQDAEKRLGTGYTTTGVRITQVHTSNHGLDITSVSLWAYPFTQEQQSSIKARIAGTSKDKATTTLLHLTGVQSVSITFENGTTIPREVQHIHLLFLQV